MIILEYPTMLDKWLFDLSLCGPPYDNRTKEEWFKERYQLSSFQYDPILYTP